MKFANKSPIGDLQCFGKFESSFIHTILPVFGSTGLLLVSISLTSKKWAPDQLYIFVKTASKNLNIQNQSSSLKKYVQDAIADLKQAIKIRR